MGRGGGQGRPLCVWGTIRTDEDAFKLLEADPNSVTVLVLPEGGGERQTNAKFTCQQSEVGEFLKKIAEL